MYVDACGVFERYHADLCRTVAIGATIRTRAGSSSTQRKAWTPFSGRFAPATRWTWHNARRKSGCTRRSRASRCGGSAATRSASRYRRSGSGTYLSNDAFETFTWEPGYVTNYENIVFDRELGFTASYMETLLMTDGGVETLSRHPRVLVVAG